MTKPQHVLAVVGLAVFLSVLDLFIVNIAFPALRADFPGAGLSGLSWVLTAYAIVFAATLVPAGRLGDLYGRRRLFVIGLALFTLGSALCAVAPSVEALVAARVLQGVGAAALTPNSLGLVLPMFPPEKRSTVIGAWAGIGAVGASIAPPLGGLLVEVSWRLIFLVNIPLGLIAIVLALRLAPEVRDERATRLPDLPGIAILVAAVGLLTLGLTEGANWGWDERVFAVFAAAAVLGFVFLRRCASHPSPVVELSLLRVPAFALAGLSTLLFSAGFAGLLLGNVLFFTQVWDYSILKAGIAFAPGPLLAATTAFTSGRLADGRRPAAFGAVGGFVFAAGCLWFITHATRAARLPDRDPPGPDPHRHRRRAAAALLHRHRGGHAAPRPALDRHRRADDVPPDRRRARARLLGGDRRDARAGRRGRRVRLRLGVHVGHRGARRARPRADGSWAARPYTACVTSDEIRESFQRFYEARDHRRQPSASLIPRNDPSTLLISAGMHPLKPYFTGRETPPHIRLTTCQKCFRTPDIDEVGLTKRHLTFFEMLGNFSIGDYFKQGAVEMAWEFSLEHLGFDPERIWITVFEGDEELGLGPDEEAIEAWLAVGVPRDRIVLLPRSENFWQAGSTGPCGPCSELYYDRGLEFGAEDDLPGGDNERFLEYWNLVFMQYDQEPEGVLTPLPAKNIDTGLGLERQAMLQQGTDSVYETDNFLPADRARRAAQRPPLPPGRRHRPRAAHPRRPLARDVVPDRRRRRALQRGPRLRAAPHHAPRDPAGPPDRHRARLPAALRGRRARADELRLPRAGRAGRDVDMWLAREEEAFGQTLEQGTRILEEHIARAKAAAPRASARPRPSSSTTPTASRST